MSKRERYPLRVTKEGTLAPADRSVRERLRDRKLKVDEIVFVEITRPRNPRFHRLAHALGRLVVENLDQFTGLEAHSALKRLQIEAQVGCDEMGIYVPGYGRCLHLIPRSMSFESMGEDDFKDVMRGICRHLADTYWPDLTADQIAEMAEVMVDE